MENYTPNEFMSSEFGETPIYQGETKVLIVDHPQNDAIFLNWGLDGYDYAWFSTMLDSLYCAFEFADIEIY